MTSIGSFSSTLTSYASSLSSTSYASSTSQTSAARLAPPPPPPSGGQDGQDGGTDAISTAADLFGMSADDLTTELASGKSLADVAEEKGVSTDDLSAALLENAPDDIKNSDDAEDMISNLINQTGLQPPQPGGGFGDGATGALSGTLTSSQSDVLDSLSSLLGTDSSTLLTSLQNGTSLSDLVSAAGVDSSSLANILEEGLLVDTSA